MLKVMFFTGNTKRFRVYNLLKADWYSRRSNLKCCRNGENSQRSHLNAQHTRLNLLVRESQNWIKMIQIVIDRFDSSECNKDYAGNWNKWWYWYFDKWFLLFHKCHDWPYIYHFYVHLIWSELFKWFKTGLLHPIR